MPDMKIFKGLSEQSLEDEPINNTVQLVRFGFGRIDSMEKELEFLKRDFFHVLKPSKKKVKPSLFGSVKGGDISEETIEQAKQSLFRKLEDI